jgi:pyridoxamine 5'-phosphate oxidase
MVYMKELDHRGFVIYSNFGTSRKARDLESNPWASLVFWWEALERQVRVEGRAERLSREESQKYYDTRVRGSRIGAWASRQSAVLVPQGGEGGGVGSDDDGRAQLQRWVEEAEVRFKGTEEIPVPEFWGGLRIVPERVEFWQGRENRLHDRFVYEKVEGQEDKWTLERLSP